MAALTNSAYAESIERGIMPLDLANLPSDLIEASPQPDPAPDQASEPANEPACELAHEVATLAEPSNPISPEPIPSQPMRQETAVVSWEPSAVYPSDNFIHALYGGFMGLPDLPGALLRANLWDSFIEAYTNPDLSHHFAHTVFPTA
jgi:hypothetical protein